MKRISIFMLLALFVIAAATAQNVWVNEIHYDNTGTDEGEFIEIVLENAGSYNLADFSVTLYNGNNGESYDTKALDVFTQGAISGNFTILSYVYPSNGIQNGESDGMAVSYQGTLIPGQFLSYEGTLTAVNGPAAGITSVDIGVSEINTEIGTSLQLSGTGSQYDEFIWQEPAAETPGQLNNGQSFGSFTPDPEPTNYPTAFIATAEDLSIHLSWIDATGEQLPAAYLILGEILTVTKAAFELPVDGEPVGDDLNWDDDGMVAVNVNYGEEMYTFSNLMSSEEYIFVIVPYTNSGSYIDYKTDGTVPTAQAGIANIVTLNDEDFNTGTLGSWTQYSVVGSQVWGPDDFGGEFFASISGFEGGSNENEDWLISPNLWEDYVFDVKFTFVSAYNYDGNPLELYISNDYDGSGNPNDFTWVSLTDLAEWSDGNWNWVASGVVNIPAEYYDTRCHLAFKYTSTAQESSTWEVDDLLVYGSTSVGIPENESAAFSFYPNPASGSVQLLTETNGQCSIFNLAGQLVHSETVKKGSGNMNISGLQTGVYLVQFIDADNRVSLEKLIVK